MDFIIFMQVLEYDSRTAEGNNTTEEYHPICVPIQVMTDCPNKNEAEYQFNKNANGRCLYIFQQGWNFYLSSNEKHLHNQAKRSYLSNGSNVSKQLQTMWPK